MPESQLFVKKKKKWNTASQFSDFRSTTDFCFMLFLSSFSKKHVAVSVWPHWVSVVAHRSFSEACNIFRVVPGLSSCSTLWHMGSQFPDQESNLHPLHWKAGFLTTGPPWCSFWTIIVSPLYLWTLHLWIQSTMDQKYLEKNVFSPKEQNLNLPCMVNYLHSNYVVFTNI